MKDFMMIFRHVPNPVYQPSAEELQASIKNWQNWIGGLAAAGQFVGTNQLGHEGKTLRAGNVITDGPYAEVKEIVGGYMLVKSESLDGALELAKGCPILNEGGHVEVRNIMDIGM